MRLIVDGQAVRAEEADDLDALSVEFRGVTPEQAAVALDGYGRVDEAHVWLEIEALRTFAPIPRSSSWDGRFDATMAYARDKGWVDDTGTLVRAHVNGLDAS